jgi:hypothetical protein
MLGTENVVMKVRDPLLTRNSGVEICHGCTQVPGNAIPVKSWILVDQVSR